MLYIDTYVALSARGLGGRRGLEQAHEAADRAGHLPREVHRQAAVIIIIIISSSSSSSIIIVVIVIVMSVITMYYYCYH